MASTNCDTFRLCCHELFKKKKKTELSSPTLKNTVAISNKHFRSRMLFLSSDITRTYWQETTPPIYILCKYTYKKKYTYYLSLKPQTKFCIHKEWVIRYILKFYLTTTHCAKSDITICQFLFFFFCCCRVYITRVSSLSVNSVSSFRDKRRSVEEAWKSQFFFILRRGWGE